MWFKNLLVYRIASARPISADDLEAALSRHALQPCGSYETERCGWLSPRDDGRYVYAVEKQWLLALGVNQKLLPAAVINEVVKERAAALAAQQDHPVGRKQLRDIRERVLAELMPQALTRRRTTRVWLDPVNHWLAVDTAAEKKADALLEALIKADSGIAAKRLDTGHSPAAAMTQWLAAGEAPHGFSIDQDLELRSSDDGQATVRYVRHALDGREIRDHIAAGKSATRLGMTWQDRISFVLTEQLQLKRLAFLDVLREEASNHGSDAEERYAADFALMAGELTRLLADLTRALGGEKKPAASSGVQPRHD
ncbi:MAG: recombination-associated protein RdgC [Burkholderiales bacterium]